MSDPLEELKKNQIQRLKLDFQLGLIRTRASLPYLSSTPLLLSQDSHWLLCFPACCAGLWLTESMQKSS